MAVIGWAGVAIHMAAGGAEVDSGAGGLRYPGEEAPVIADQAFGVVLFHTASKTGIIEPITRANEE